MTGYIYSRQGYGLVERRSSHPGEQNGSPARRWLEDARDRARQQESPLLLLGMACVALGLAAGGLRVLLGGRSV